VEVVYFGRNGRVAMASRCRYAPAVWVSLRLHFGLPTRSADSKQSRVACEFPLGKEDSGE